MSTEPGACPFCGGIDLLATHLSDIALKYCWSHERWAVICKNCGAIGPHVDVKRDGPGTTKLGMTESFEIWSRRPATPAPESPAPARVEVEIMKPLPVYPNPDAMRMEDLFQEVGTGSETSPDAGASIREPAFLEQAWQEISGAMSDSLLNPTQKKAFVVSILKGQLANPPKYGGYNGG